MIRTIVGKSIIPALLLTLAAMPAYAAQDADYTLPDGNMVHRHIMAPVQCLRVGTDPKPDEPERKRL
jgi:hypothetical protein